MINELVNEVADLIDTAYKTAGQQPPVISHSRIEAALRRQGLHFHSEAIERFAEIAPAGPDGQKAIQLLAKAKKAGTATLAELTRKALARHLQTGGHFVGPLFNEEELAELAKMIAETNGTAELLGRARVRRRQEQAEKNYGSFAEGFDPDEPRDQHGQWTGGHDAIAKRIENFLAHRLETDFPTIHKIADDAGTLSIAQLKQLSKSIRLTLIGTSKKQMLESLRSHLTAIKASAEQSSFTLGKPKQDVSEQAERQHGVSNFSEVATDFSCFKEGEPLHPMTPLKALEYFRSLVPKLNIDANGFNGHIEQEAFRMALATDDQMRERVQQIIAEILETGKGLSDAPRQINEILERAGVHPKNPGYAANVVRSNLMNSYNRGWQEELREPDVKEAFPVWRYLGIDDGRQRKRHEIHFDKYFSADTTFESVRDKVKGSYDGFQ